MILNKIKYTDAEIAEIERIDEFVIENEAAFFNSDTPEEKLQQALRAHNQAMLDRLEITNAAKARYIEATKGDYKQIIADVSEILEAYTLDDYTSFVSPFRKQLDLEIQRDVSRIKRLKAAGNTKYVPSIEQLIEKNRQWLVNDFSFTYRSAKNRLLSLTVAQLEAIESGGHPHDDYNALIIGKAESLYPIGEGEQSQIVDAEERSQEPISGQLSLFTNEPQPQDSPLLQSIYAPWHIMPNSALMNTLQQKAAINAGPFDIVVANASNHRKEIVAYTIVEFDPADTGLQFPGDKLSEYERQVSDAIISLWVEAIKRGLPPIFTTDAIFRAMPGGGDKASPQQRGAITRTIEKFRRLHIKFNPTEELRRRGIIGPDEEWIIDDNYLYARHVIRKIKNGGQTVSGYMILAEPVMLTYANLTKQLISIDHKHLEIQKLSHGQPKGEILRMNAPRQSMTGYMLRRIAVMKKDLENAKDKLRNYNKRRQKDPTLEEKPLEAFREQSSTIVFSTLFAETRTETTNRDKIMDNRNFCFQVLDYWKATGYIKGYQKQIKGRAITGISIDI